MVNNKDNQIANMKNNNTKKITITIGIPAYNEENNIRNILTALLRQKQTHWSLDKIIVVCDGCTDKTVEYAQSIQSDKIEVIVNKKREGKAIKEQKIIEAFDSDYLVMVDADVLPTNDFLTDNLIATFLKDDKISLVSGNSRPFQPTSFFERAVYTTFFVRDKSRKFVKGGNSIYGCSGKCLAMKKEFAKTIKFPPKILAEDDYIYFSCISIGRIFRHCPSAIVYYKLPKTLEDYIRQIFRADPDASTRNVQEYFGKIVSDEYHRPFKPYIWAVLQAFINNPPGAILMIIIRLISKPLGPIISNNYKLEWFTAESTK